MVKDIQVNKSKTKDIIADRAITAFNDRGYDAVSLYELAQEIGISRGNLTYHFRDKDALLQYIAEQMWEALGREREKSRLIPSFKNLHNEVQLYYKIQKAYAFIFLDTKILSHPVVADRFRQLTEASIKDNLAAITLSITIGNMHQEKINGTYHNLAFLTWMVSFFWYAQQIIRGQMTEQDGERMLWTMIIPHFTDQGIERFAEFFGNDYLNNLGKPFELSAESLITF